MSIRCYSRLQKINKHAVFIYTHDDVYMKELYGIKFVDNRKEGIRYGK